MNNPPFLGINHISVVTADLDAAVRTWQDRYGIGPWELYTYERSMIDAEVGGEPVEFGMRAGFCNLDATTRIELIQPLDENSPYAESLRRHGGANHFHHMRLDVGDYEAAKDRLDGLELDRVLDGEFAGDEGTSSKAIYFDTTEDLGFLVELAQMSDPYVRIQPDGSYP